MSLAERIRFAASTDVGRVRPHNEDNFLVDKRLHLYIVADGMGGHLAGEVASSLCVRVLHDELKKRKDALEIDPTTGKVDTRFALSALVAAVHVACRKVHEESLADPGKRGMGTTVSVLLIVGNYAFVAHVGDSRIYLYRGARVRQLTEDHTVQNELIRRGKLRPDQVEKLPQRNAITRAIGIYESVEVDTLTLEILPGDQFLLASDGLHGYLTQASQLGTTFEMVDEEAAVSQAIAMANERGGRDNITVVLVRVGAGDAADETRARKVALKLDVLGGMPLFLRLNERELLRVVQICEVVPCAKGQVLFEEGSKGDELFVVLQGRVRISRGEAELAQFGPGEHFGEMALIRTSPRSAAATATEDSELLVLKRQDFFDILRQEHELSVKMLWQFLGVLADRLERTSQDLSEAYGELAGRDMDVIFPEDAKQTVRPANES